MPALTTDQINKITGDPQATVEVRWSQTLLKWEVVPMGSSTIYFVNPAEPNTEARDRARRAQRQLRLQAALQKWIEMREEA